MLQPAVLTTQERWFSTATECKAWGNTILGHFQNPPGQALSKPIICEMSLAESCLTLKSHPPNYILYYTIFYFQWQAHNDNLHRKKGCWDLSFDHVKPSWDLSPWNVISGLYRKAGIAHGAIIINSKFLLLLWCWVFTPLPRRFLQPAMSFMLSQTLLQAFHPSFKLITSQLQYRHTLPGNSATDSFLALPAKSEIWFKTHPSSLGQTSV